MTVDELRRGRRAEGPATILAIGTANPENYVDQSTYPDYYFRVTNSQHMTELKGKFKRMCDRSAIKKRYMHLTEDLLKEHPNLCTYMAPSFNLRQEIAVEHAPILGSKAAKKAIEEWGQSKSKITHLIFNTSSSVDMPGADHKLVKLLDLRPSVRRYMMYQQGCFAGGTILRLAKDLAENNAGARVLVVSCELTTVCFHAPSDADLDSLVVQSLFGDGAAALIVGSDPDLEVERPWFEIVSAAQTILPDTQSALGGQLREHGMSLILSKENPDLISQHIEESLKQELFDPFGISDPNSIFWIMHPGGRAILDKIETKLGLMPEKLRCSRHVLSEYGNMASVSVLFVIDEMRKSSVEQGLRSTGEGFDWGVVLSFGPGITVETLVLHSVPIRR